MNTLGVLILAVGGLSTTMPATGLVRVLRRPPRVEDHDAPTVVYSTSGGG